MGAELYDLKEVVRGSAPVATYDDGTLAQFHRHPDSDLRRMGLPNREVRRWIASQASACNAAAASCVSTNWAASSVVDDYGVARSKVHVVGMGHHPVPRQGGGARDWATPAFLFVGVDWERKNGEAVLRAFSRLRQAHPEATLSVVGNHPRLDVAGVTGHGLLSRDRPEHQARLHHLFNASTVFVLPSRFEPAGIAYLEAASAGLAVISTTEGGAAELLGDAAAVVRPADDGGLLAAMTALSTPGEACARGSAGRRRAATSEWTAVSGRIVKVLGASSNASDGGDTVDSDG